MDYSRQLDVFDPTTFKTPVHVIGAGATGSWLVLSLAKLGITNITVWDFDEVEEHNIPNQAYRISYFDEPSESNGYKTYGTDIGSPKVEALQDMVYKMTGIEIKAMNQRVIGTEKLEGIVFVMTDTMKSRKDIWDRGLKYKVPVKLVVEPRMGLDGGRIYCINPLDVKQIKTYEASLYTDEEAAVSACGASQTVVATAMGMASHCVWKLINFHNGEPIPNLSLLDFRYQGGIQQYTWE